MRKAPRLENSSAGGFAHIHVMLVVALVAFLRGCAPLLSSVAYVTLDPILEERKGMGLDVVILEEADRDTLVSLLERLRPLARSEYPKRLIITESYVVYCVRGVDTTTIVVPDPSSTSERKGEGPFVSVDGKLFEPDVLLWDFLNRYRPEIAPSPLGS